VSINGGEIKFRHPKAPKPLIYTCDQFLDEGLLLRDTGSKGRKYQALFDLRWTDEIYVVRQAGGEEIPCRLRDQNSIHVNRDWEETVRYLDDVKALRDEEESTVVKNEINFSRRMQERVSRANKRRREDMDKNPPQSKSAAVKGIRSNRKTEIESMHEEEASRRRSGDVRTPVKQVDESHPRGASTDARSSREIQMPDISELRKKRMGR
jgi:Ulp1 family protease